MLYVAYRWFDRLLGFVSLIILARILAPEDFGVLAMATIVVGMLDQLFNFGIHVVVLQKRQDEVTKEFLDSAWTLRLIQSSIVAVLIAAGAELGANYYQEDRVAMVLYLLAIASFSYGVENLAIVMFQKERKFFAEFKLAAITRVAGFFVTLLLAVTLKSYLALVFGILFTRFLAVTLSYVFYPVVHSVEFSHFREVFNAGKWMLALNWLIYLWRRVDELIVGRLFSTDSMGNYTVASEIARMPTTELLSPIARALLPGLASLQGKPAEMRKLVMSATNIQASLALPAAIGIALCGPRITTVVLGDGWELAGELLMLLPLGFAAASMRHAGECFLLSQGRQRLLTGMHFGYLAVFLIPLVLMGANGVSITIVTIVLCRVAVEGFAVPVVWLLAARENGGIRFSDDIASTARPVLATAFMAGLLVMAGVLDNAGGLPSLLLYVGVGMFAYTGSLLVIWIIARKPRGGIESYVIEKLPFKKLHP